MEVRLDGKVALVTGASKGIGRAIAAQLAASGARVMLSSRKEDALAEAASTMDGEVAWFAANAGEPDAAEACVAATVERFGAVDVLVNNAATNPYAGPLIGLDRPRAEKTFQVNVLGPLVWSQACWWASMERSGGVILNVSSIGGLRGGSSSLGWYSMTKAALLHLTQSLAGELGPGVRVNAICPGIVKTDMARALWETDEDGVARTYALERLGVPDDVATMAVFLASDAASWVTGGTFLVDGGALVGGAR
ncbi:MAG TPA: SDR family oxidoreductase [Acidimicrobiales bacterium]|nr:SDR family oxidoreductase [Acidimicrobiales bacterium]